jgi:NAD+ synthase (glutamine-hydrolysing)
MRTARAFDTGWYITTKTQLIADYLRAHQLSGVIVSVSGGVDSALCAALVAVASTVEHSPIRRITYVTAPVCTHGVVTGQDTATSLGQLSMQTAGELAGDNVHVDCLTVDLASSYDTLEAAVRGALGEPQDPWARGQLAATIRTPALYYLTSMLTAAGNPAVVAGTTNRDEGAWLGYVGKASDGMVDVQVISDLHKSEVYTCARALGVPGDVLDAVPTGDMYDGARDTDVFGAPYDFVELYLGWLCWTRHERDTATADWDGENRWWFDTWAGALDELHAANAHKYLVGSPAVHLDVYPAGVPGGWADREWRP